MPDDYHFTLDPATLIDARLTKDEAEAIASYRNAKELAGDRLTRNLVIVIPVSLELADEETVREAERAAMRAVADTLVARDVRGLRRRSRS